jgi:hypothetical protein
MCVAGAVFGLAASMSHATDVRGRVELRSNGASPLTHAGIAIELRVPDMPQAPVRKTLSGRDGSYYIADIPPGRYLLVVNGVAYPISVEQVAIQELPPIRVNS